MTKKFSFAAVFRLGQVLVLLLLLVSADLPAAGWAFRCRFDAFRAQDHADIERLIQDELKLKVWGDNPAFIHALKNQPATWARLFSHVDNAVLKKFSERYFPNQEVVAATECLYTRLFFQNFETEPLFAEFVYSDYKTIRSGYLFDTEAKRQALSRVYRENRARFRT